MHNGALKPEGGRISSTTLKKMKSDVWVEPVTPSRKSNPGLNRRRVKTYGSSNLSINWLSCNEDN